jgi:hypothetical protein
VDKAHARRACIVDLVDKASNPVRLAIPQEGTLTGTAGTTVAATGAGVATAMGTHPQMVEHPNMMSATQDTTKKTYYTLPDSMKGMKLWSRRRNK